MSFREDEIGGTARCGRCAGILPDETLTFCPQCGVPFSRVPPTSSYVALVDKREAMARQSVRRRFFAFTSIGIALLGVSLSFVSGITGHSSLNRARALPPVEFYTFEVGEFPRLSPSTRRQSISVAVQAFEDHFGFPLRDYSVHEDKLPSEVEPYFRGPWSGADLSSESPMLLSFWEKRLYPKLFREWRAQPQRPLRVLITNIPLFASDTGDSDLELRHLSGSGLVSGLGHPSFVVTTTYRMLTRDREYADAGAPLRTETDYARHLGEYIVAHELGHALLGLSDYVVAKRTPAAKSPIGLRAPASLGLSAEDDPIAENCLMHTDEGGGFAAWKKLSERPLGLPSPCRAYSAALEAFDLRAQSLALYRAGHGDEAVRLHGQALEKARSSDLQDWVRERWTTEHSWFGLSLFRP